MRLTRTLVPLAMASLLAIALPPAAGDRPCTSACGHLTPVVDCLHWGAVSGVGFSGDRTTHWEMYFTRVSSVKGSYLEIHDSWGSSTEFFADDHDASRAVGGTYVLQAWLYADDELVDAVGLRCG